MGNKTAVTRVTLATPTPARINQPFSICDATAEACVPPKKSPPDYSRGRQKEQGMMIRKLPLYFSDLIYPTSALA